MSRSNSENRRAEDRPLRRVRSFRVDARLLRSLRLARGWTQQEAAERADLTDRFIRKAESGQPIEFKSARLLAHLYSTSDAPLTPERLLLEPPVDLALPLPPGSHAGVLGRDENGQSSTAPLEDSLEGAAIVCRWIDEVWNQGRLKAIDELTAANCVFRAEGVTIRGPAAIRQRAETIRAGHRSLQQGLFDHDPSLDSRNHPDPSQP